VVAQDGYFTVLNDRVQALARIRAIADNIAQAKDPRHILRSNVFENRVQRLVIAVNITYQRPLHRVYILPAWYPRRSQQRDVEPIGVVDVSRSHIIYCRSLERCNMGCKST